MCCRSAALEHAICESSPRNCRLAIGGGGNFLIVLNQLLSPALRSNASPCCAHEIHPNSGRHSGRPRGGAHLGPARLVSERALLSPAPRAGTRNKNTAWRDDPRPCRRAPSRGQQHNVTPARPRAPNSGALPLGSWEAARCGVEGRESDVGVWG
eukprot:scaffold213643_cov31-Tisochrysis_lutea.AAC.1